MNKQKSSNMKVQKGFTLIEVVLVLAIGGLIFLLAFLAFQQVSTNRRDAQRRADAGRILAELSNFMADSSSGVVSSTITGGSSAVNTGICTTGSGNSLAAFSTNYLCKNGLFTSPGGTNYNTLVFNSPDQPAKDQILITTSFVIYGVLLTANDCEGNPMGIGSYRVNIGLEKGVACRDNS